MEYTQGMNAPVRKVLKDALRLPPAARAELARSLIRSLEDEPDPDAEKAWAQEIRRRLEDLESGRVKPIPWSKARRMIFGPRRAGE
jgi:putative addiction module component (TIGR02574 family)